MMIPQINLKIAFIIFPSWWEIISFSGKNFISEAEINVGQVGAGHSAAVYKATSVIFTIININLYNQRNEEEKSFVKSAM